MFSEFNQRIPRYILIRVAGFGDDPHDGSFLWLGEAPIWQVIQEFLRLGSMRDMCICPGLGGQFWVCPQSGIHLCSWASVAATCYVQGGWDLKFLITKYFCFLYWTWKWCLLGGFSICGWYIWRFPSWNPSKSCEGSLVFERLQYYVSTSRIYPKKLLWGLGILHWWTS